MATINLPSLTIEGTIYDAFNVPIPQVTVQVFDKDLRTEQLLGTTETDVNGKYIIIYNSAKFARADKQRADVYLKVFTDKSFRKELGKSPLHFNVTSKYLLDFKVDGTPYLGLSEFETLTNTIAPLLQGQRVKIENLNEEDIDFISAETQIPASILSLLAIAFKNTKTKIAPDIFYALFRLQYPTKLDALFLVQSESLVLGIKEAIKSNIISSKWQKEIPAIIRQFNALSSQFILESKGKDLAESQTMFKTILTTKSLRQSFIDTQLATEAKPETFWKVLEKKTGFTANIIADTQNILKLNALTSQPLVTSALFKLQKTDTKLKETRDYTKLTALDLEKIIKSSDIKTFPQDVVGKTKKQKIANYARVLETRLGKIFPTDAFKHRMIQDQNHPFGTAKTDLGKFLSKNQNFDLKTTIIERLLKQSDFRSIRNIERTKKQLKQINRIYKIGGNYENTRAILKAGLTSAFDIVQMPKAEFINTISKSADISKATAKKLHKQAVLTDNRTTALAARFKTESDIIMYATGDPTSTKLSADLQSLFKDSNTCDCEHCQSVYSPSAYFVDMLNFMKNEAPDAFEGISKRRPDLLHILLTCKNTNTALPYIDLVNEVLEKHIVNPTAPLDSSNVPQTTNTVEELIAFPEHTITDVYENKLSDIFSSFELPFNLHLEETRIYLEKLNCKRHELMELFYGKRGNHKLDDLAIAIEYLGLSENELKVINGDNITAVANIPTNKVSEFLEHTGLSYAELLPLLECQFINPILSTNPFVRTIKIEANTANNKANCDVTKLELKGLDNTTTKHILRFIRLWKKLDWDILDLDRAFTALGINKGDFDNPADDINTKLVIPLSHISRIKHSYGLTIPEILSLWANIPNENYVDTSRGELPIINSLYDSLFKNKTISNPLDVNFKNPKNLPSSKTLKSKWSIITAAFNISESDFNLLNESEINQNLDFDGKLRLKNLSVLYRYTTLAKILRLKIEELLLLIKMTEIQPFEGTEKTLNLFLFIEKVELIQSTNFSLQELADLLKRNPSDDEQLDPNIVSSVLATLREGLKKTDSQFLNSANDAAEASKKLVTQQSLIIDSLSSAFNSESKIIRILLNGMVKFTADNTKPAFFPFIENQEAIASSNPNGVIEWTNSDLVDTYTELHKTWKRLEQLMIKFSITADEFIYFQHNEDILNLKGVWNLPTIDFEQFRSFENLFNLLQFRNKLIQPTEDWYLIFAHLNSESDFLAKINSLTNIEQTELISLKSADNLAFTFPEDYLDGKNLINLIDCNNKIRQLGSTVENTSALTAPNPDNTTASIAKNILKAKYIEKEWLDIIKPISNQLRDKKRNALLSYLLTASETQGFRSTHSLLNSNDLFAYFLIDTEMAPCMMTSRIKQAISSVQLFIDRCLMGLEEGISVNTDFSKQWYEWRKVYRVWEANRKVFLYPENWIEPELRDDKSPFFKELESKLTQNEITDDLATDALLEYLEKLDTVANLEIIAFFNDESTKITHVLGRTKNIPHQYFYRKQQKSIWTAWEKMELDIQENHILLVVWNNRLMVFWTEYTEAQAEIKKGDNLFTEDDQGNISSGSTPKKSLKIKLNWSEYKNKKWGDNKVSKMFIKLSAFLGKKQEVSLGSSFENGQLFVSLYRREPKGIGFAGLQVKRLVGNFQFNTYNNDPIAIQKDDIETVKRLEIVPNYTPINMYLYEYESIGKFSIFQSGLYRYKYIINSPSKRLVFSKTSGNSKLLTNHHKIKINKPVKFFYMSEENNFYVQSHQKQIINNVITDVQVLDSVSARIFNEPSPIGTFANNTETFAFEANSDLIATNFPSLEVLPSNNSISFKRTYSFQTFYHPFVCEYIKALNTDGIDALYKEKIQTKDDVKLFTDDNYKPNPSNVKKPYPVEKVDFDLNGSYSIYNWELFYHIPLLIASRLSQNQKFEEARKWFHYIFDPTKSIDQVSDINEGVKRFWITKPFKQQIDDQQNLSIEDLINNENNTGELKIQLQNWQDNPFNPHAVARFRTSAYMRSTVMKYIDNLMSWGDQLFRRDSIESINEATQLYILAANLLGDKPENIPARKKQIETTFDNINETLNPFSNAKVAIESFLTLAETNESGEAAPISMPLFCLPKNKKLLGYWDNIADKLFKIRNCMNIEGDVRQLSLFEPEIDPALLVRARAAGLDLNSVLNDVNATLPNYRFQVILQKANELCNDVKSLGSQLLATLEKKDAEELSLLRSGHEIKLLGLIRDIKKKQINEAKENLRGLLMNQMVTENRRAYYESREFMNPAENNYFNKTKDATKLQQLVASGKTLASLSYLLPEIKIGSGFTIGSTYGGDNIGKKLEAAAGSLSSYSNYLTLQASMSNIKGGNDRRMDDWKFQAKTAKLELKQIDKQIIAAEIRLAIAEKDLTNHEVQIEQSKKVDDYMRGKFTNAELYNYMITQISGIYFQTYQMAYDYAKQAEKCYQFELGIADSNLIKFGHWDSLKKGLLSGEKLQFNLRRLENSFFEDNKREFELSKHISLKSIDPLALIKLREKGTCDFSLFEELFDLDYPGHYFRRIKSVSISLPCIVGPYTTVSCTLSLTTNDIRIEHDIGNQYKKNLLPEEDKRFIQNKILIKSIATSSAQNDSGVFEINFRDERYLPFEGAGATSSWTIDLFNDEKASDFGKSMRQFDYNTISDAIIHIKYTAKQGTNDFKQRAMTNLKNFFESNNTTPKMKIINVKHDFPSEWHKFQNSDITANNNFLNFILTTNQFSFIDNGHKLKINKIIAIAKCKDDDVYTIKLTVNGIVLEDFTINQSSKYGNLHHALKDVSSNSVVFDLALEYKWNIEILPPAGHGVKLSKNDITELFFVLEYEWND